VDVLTAVGVGFSSGGAFMTNGRDTSTWVGVAVNGIDEGDTTGLVAWHPLRVSHRMNKKIPLFFMSRKQFK
jgi:hypothetical protein